MKIQIVVLLSIVASLRAQMYGILNSGALDLIGEGALQERKKFDLDASFFNFAQYLQRFAARAAVQCTQPGAPRFCPCPGVTNPLLALSTTPASVVLNFCAPACCPNTAAVNPTVTNPLLGTQGLGGGLLGNILGGNVFG
ncbi:unnamed protein product [Nippostrongylus brasiliensis]|uniref:Secreted protein n=1 Tax=Nippostrongylus brasiliensis TaxID=27835 RepID=A0A0N4YHZ6_NIPBR|nr:unnamed protein product [Nippostrongylus brasiliensis]